ncbi:hypothetical protein A2164_00680 [Candidatus Curtissbacteria bacterium RBG_13_35_7]|uniref:ArnT-like N-terminal domain-containing protein n=1 Tax=Candidatus Curtissbacteria bacterium RBG_13_35_7 TaxID=1797705 RepID=A0A1F5G346_9BACT|nr:MAG: hypothetical protein A2164_00680 [Candidatus Curtissbacteria bacterium RBG_13_35_7]
MLKNNFLLICIILIATILRFYQLSQIPPGLYSDEVSNGYNAYSILKTARDEYGNLLPLSFRSFGDYKPPFYIYVLVPSIAVFGLNDFAVRFPSAFAGVLTVLLTYIFTRQLFKNNNIALWASFFLAISPWHLQFSRGGFEANFMIFLTLLGVVLFLNSFKKSFLLIPSVISFGLALNTYQGAKLWVPLILLCIIVFYLKYILRFGKKLYVPLLILMLLAIPLFHNFNNNLIRGKSVSIFENSDKPIEEFITGYLSHYSPRFLFMQGDSIGRHSVPGIGELYVFEIPLVAAGLFALIKSKQVSSKFLLTWLLIAPIPASFATPVPHALRSLTFIPVWAIISSYGLKTLSTVPIKKFIKLIAAFILLLIASYNIATYFHLYYKHYPKEKGPDWGDGYKQMVQYVETIKRNYDTIAITKWYGDPYIFTLFYLKYDPKKYLNEGGNKNGFDKFVFFPTTGKEIRGKTLYITNPDHSTVLQQIRNYKGDVVFDALE